MRVWLAVLICAAAAPAMGCDTAAGRSQGVCYAEPTDRYDHGVLGDAIEWGAIKVLRPGREWVVYRLPADMVFEDVAPRIAYLGPGEPRAIVVESHTGKGARLAVWDAEGRIAATPFIGTRHRWLAPVGAADLDGDGRVEIAYVETPHRDKVLKLVRLEGDRLVATAELAGLTNHRIGEDFIQGGIADCGDGPVILTADADWTTIVETRFDGAALVARNVGPYSGPASLAAALACH